MRSADLEPYLAAKGMTVLDSVPPLGPVHHLVIGRGGLPVRPMKRAFVDARGGCGAGRCHLASDAAAHYRRPGHAGTRAPGCRAGGTGGRVDTSGDDSGPESAGASSRADRRGCGAAAPVGAACGAWTLAAAVPPQRRGPPTSMASGTSDDRAQAPPAAQTAVHRRVPVPVQLADGAAGLLIAWMQEPGAGWWGQVVTIRNAETDAPSVSWTWYPQDQITQVPFDS